MFNPLLGFSLGSYVSPRIAMQSLEIQFQTNSTVQRIGMACQDTNKRIIVAGFWWQYVIEFDGNLSSTPH